MADTQTAPHPATEPIPALGGSVTEAQEALLSLLTPEEEKPEEESAEPTEVEESQPEEEDESLEEESEEEEEESEEETEEESEEADQEEEPTEKLYTVRVDGEDVEVSLDELAKGYSRQSDYTKKTQELSEHRRQIEGMANQYAEEIAGIQENRQQYINAMANMVQMEYSALQNYANINWEELKENDRDEYLLKRDEYREAESKMNQTQEAIQVEQQKQEYEQQVQFDRVAREEYGKLASIIPQWQDDTFRSKVTTELQNFAKSKGFSNEEIHQLVDHRSILILLEAKAFEDSQRNKKVLKTKKLKNKPRVARTGSPKEKSTVDKRKRTEQMKRLRGTGHIDDASALLEDFIDI